MCSRLRKKVLLDERRVRSPSEAPPSIQYSFSFLNNCIIYNNYPISRENVDFTLS